MKKIIKIGIPLCIFLLLLSGCRRDEAPQPTCRVVTGVDISFRYEDMRLQRHYTDNKKVESVLLYLRLLKPLGKAYHAQELPEEDLYEITVHLSDGSDRIYRQKAHRYFSRPERPWEQIDPGQASQLYQLMRHYPSDSTF